MKVKTDLKSGAAQSGIFGDELEGSAPDLALLGNQSEGMEEGFLSEGGPLDFRPW